MNDIDISRNLLMLSVDDKQYSYSKSVFKKRKIGTPLKITGIKSPNHEYACRMGHHRMVEHAIKSNLPYYIALEDDAYPCDDCTIEFEKVMKRLNKSGIEWDILLIGICGEHSDESKVYGNDGMDYCELKKSENIKQKTDSFLTIRKNMHGCTAYVVKSDAYSRLSKMLIENDDAADYILTEKYCSKYGLNVVVSSKMLFAQHKVVGNEHVWWYPYFYSVENIQFGPMAYSTKSVPDGFSIERDVYKDILSSNVYIMSIGKCNYHDEDVYNKIVSFGFQNSNCSFKYVNENIFKKIIYDVSKSLKSNDCRSNDDFNMSFAHYECIKESFDNGFEGVVIIDGNCRFLNDEALKSALNSIPTDSDVVIFSPIFTSNDSLVEYYADSTATYVRCKKIDNSKTFYYLSRNAMDAIIKGFEKHIYDFDSCIGGLFSENGITSYYSTIPLSISDVNSGNKAYDAIMRSYKNMGIDFDDYSKTVEPSECKHRFKVVIPVYNSGKYVARCIESIRKQHYDNYHVILIDDMSTDDSVEVIEKCIRGDRRFEFIRLKKKGFAGGARNEGLKIDDGSDYTIFIDSDDYFISCYAFSEIDRKLTENNDSDCLVISFYYQKQKKIVSYNRNFSTDEYIRSDIYYAPWINVVKNSKLPTFTENVRYEEDVIFHFKLLDNIDTVCSTNMVIINYSDDSVDTSWNNKDVRSKNEIDNMLSSRKTNMELLKNMKFRKKELPVIVKRRYSEDMIRELNALNSV